MLGLGVPRTLVQRARVASSLVPRRTKTSLIPPNVSSFKEIGKLTSAHPQAHPDIFNKMKQFYSRIPKGPRQQVTATTFWGRYYENYFAKDSFVPVLHFLGIMIPVGYTITYFIGGSTGVFAADNLKKFVPNVKLSGETTLGQLWEGIYVKYKYRLAYPVGLWVGFLWYNLWQPYKSAEEKKKIAAHEDRLSKLEYHQE
ncbi:hypothetical protein HDU67_004440 [Dinochytrium kinnereticum]|nr:hypothetical protein HDU67_004440 [Dinochytrium kinnereticum]